MKQNIQPNVQQNQQGHQVSSQQTPSGLELMAGSIKKHTGKLLVGAMIFAAGMGVESGTNYFHKTNEHAKMVRYAVEGYQLEGDPQYRDAKIELHVDHDTRTMYGAIVDEDRGVSVKLNDGLITRDSVPKEFYRLVKDDLEDLWDGVNNFKNDAKSRSREGMDQAWEQTKDAYQNLSDEVEKRLR